MPKFPFLTHVPSNLRSLRWDQLFKFVFRGPRPRDQVERNIWYLYIEIFWAAMLSAAAAFNAASAVRLGASNAMIGWLSSIPSLLAVVLLVPAARFLESKANRGPWIWGSLFVARLGYALVALLPWLFSDRQAQALIWLLIAISVPSTFFSAGFTPLLADVIPERDRARVFANRNIILSATVAVLTFVAGKWLEATTGSGRAAFPVSYQVMYAIGFIASMVSMAYLLKIEVPESSIVQRKSPKMRRRLAFAQLKTMLAENRDFVVMILNTLVFDLGAWMVGPLYILFFVRELGATDGWIGLNSTLANAGVIAGYTLWRRWIRRLGYNCALRLSVPLAASYAFLVSLFPNLPMILVWGVLINLINPGVNLSHFNILLKLCPSDRRASYIAFYSALMNAGAFVGPMVGVALAEVWGIRSVLLVGGGVRLLGAMLFNVFRLDVQEGDIR